MNPIKTKSSKSIDEWVENVQKDQSFLDAELRESGVKFKYLDNNPLVKRLHEASLQVKHQTIKDWLTGELKKADLKNTNKPLHEALDDWWSTINLPCVGATSKHSCNNGDNLGPGKPNRIPIFLPCNPSHVICFDCLNNKRKSTKMRIAREYDGTLRTGITFDICYIPITEQTLKLIPQNPAQIKEIICFSYASARYHTQLAKSGYVNKDKFFDKTDIPSFRGYNIRLVNIVCRNCRLR